MSVVSAMESHLFYVGIPLLVTAVLSALIWRPKGPRPVTYKLGEKWTHTPILWAATDEHVGHAHGGHATSGSSVGGGASGKW